jgi:hypothetical protein
VNELRAYPAPACRHASGRDRGPNPQAAADSRAPDSSTAYHPEAKFADAQGEPCRKRTVGLLHRRHVRIGLLTNIGKESNSLEEVQARLVHDGDDAYTTYDDPSRGDWQTKILHAVRKAPLAMLVKACAGKLSRRALIDIRVGRSTPHRKNQELLRTLLRSLGLL